MALTLAVIKLLDTNYPKSFHVDDFWLDTIKELFNILILPLQLFSSVSFITVSDDSSVPA